MAKKPLLAHTSSKYKLNTPGTKAWEKQVLEAIKAGTKITLSESCKEMLGLSNIQENLKAYYGDSWEDHYNNRPNPQIKAAQQFLVNHIGDK